MRPAHETAQLALARLPIDTLEAREHLLEEAGRVSARTLRVARVSIWFFSDDRTRLHCTMVFVRDRDSRGSWDGVPTLEAALHPAYFEALGERRVIAASDARHHPVTRELTAAYLAPLDIRSLLDAPLYVAGAVVGVVCHEAVGAIRDWSQEDVDFAASVASLVSASLVQLEWRECQQVLTRRASQLRDYDRLETLSRLVGAFVHDLNNVLNVVTLSAGALRRGMAPLDEVIDGLEEGAGIGSRLLAQLKAFVDRDTDGDRLAPVGDVVGCLRPVVDLLVRGQVRFTIEIEPAIAPLLVPRSRIEQVLLNLCLNARDAITDHGTVVLRARAARDDEGPGAIAIEVEDTGAGMSPDTLVRVFEPYFTTKQHGTGLGLATSRALVEEMGGHISARSEPGRGSVFTIVIPGRTERP
jgi:signal transduction histidine kinase